MTRTSGQFNADTSINPVQAPASRSGASLRERLLASVGFVLLALLAAPLACAQQPEPEVQSAPTDATFTFTADVHVAFNGIDDHQGIDDNVINNNGDPNDLLLIKNETLLSPLQPGTHHDGCLSNNWFGMEKDLCNQIQLVRKLNHLPTNTWSTISFKQNGHPTKLSSAGRTIGTPLGLIIAGDLTDCGGGSDDVKVGLHSEHCDINYGNGVEGAELWTFEQLFDKAAGVKFQPLEIIPVIKGLEKPDSDVPLQYPIFPGLGNHDLGYDKSGLMMDYIRQWSFAAPPGTAHHVTNSDPVSGAYSWDWGRLHIVNAGVFAGSSNTSQATDSNYAYSDEAMAWLKADLKQYASDGRPVILAQHFGFDPYSFSTNWYLDSAALEGAQNIWAALAPYNVVGIFHGHHHEQQFYSFSPGESYAGYTPIPSYRLPYDMFEPGPGFGQDFAVIRVTDNTMDVQATLWYSDFDNTQTTVDFVASDTTRNPPVFFNKRLLPAPTASTAVSVVERNDAVAVSAFTHGLQFVVGSTSAGAYTVRLVNPGKSTEVESTGKFPVEPKFLTSYVLRDLPYLLVSDGYSIVSYSLSQKGVLTRQWEDGATVHSFAVVYDSQQKPYLVVNQNGGYLGVVRFEFFQLTAQSMSSVGVILITGSQSSAEQLIPFQVRNGGFGLVRYVPTGQAEIYTGEIATSGEPGLSLGSTEEWLADAHFDNAAATRSEVLIQAVTLADQTTGILVKSPICLHYNAAGNCAEPNTYDSPYSVRTLTQDGVGTEISWRGALPIPTAINAVAVFPVSPDSVIPEIGFYSSDGFLSTVQLHANLRQ